ncbi:SGNH hydrolase-type esterase domain-containing protein [Lophiotrema nucula]|uniref:SGNH hydrolase-type esterase domain-containing protein n=1 Tax=Lophiotrema nucula TaxID=690887 RepID=A0A6A5YH94_9PLEO|nr:SGNH hydrolase-type esterase domain-containing protein [Lophiotrema nucula]
MKRSYLSLGAIAASTCTALSLPFRSTSNTSKNKPPAFILAGDSTTAIQNPAGGGWGYGFLSFLKSPGWGIDLGIDGATTVSYVKGNIWYSVEGYVATKLNEGYAPYVTIAFGHNDQKPAANISLDQYQTNLEVLARNISILGATPLLVTPLTRRAFTSEHNATDSLHDQRLRTIAAAEAVGATLIDLNKYSLEYVDRIGNESAQAYNLDDTPSDTTHLNVWGSVVFGRIVADLLLAEVAELRPWFKSNESLSYKISHGTAAYET